MLLWYSARNSSALKGMPDCPCSGSTSQGMNHDVKTCAPVCFSKCCMWPRLFDFPVCTDRLSKSRTSTRLCSGYSVKKHVAKHVPDLFTESPSRESAHIRSIMLAVPSGAMSPSTFNQVSLTTHPGYFTWVFSCYTILSLDFRINYFTFSFETFS